MDQASNRIFGCPRLDFFGVSSTLDVAQTYAASGAGHGTLVTASHQTAGRGRRGARWLDQPGASALMSFVLRLGSDSLERSWRVTFAASLACARALRGLDFDDVRVKWPNDLAIGGKKIGGVIAEPGGRSPSELTFLLGIGINVAQDSFPGSDGYALAPTSLLLAARGAGRSRVPNSIDVIAGVTAELDSAWNLYSAGGDELIEQWRAHQMTGHLQQGFALSDGKLVTGIYRDVRVVDGAGLVKTPGSPDLTPIAPTQA